MDFTRLNITAAKRRLIRQVELHMVITASERNRKVVP